MVALLARLAARYSPLAAAAAAVTPRLPPSAAARASSSLRPLDMGPPPPPRTRSAARAEQQQAPAAQLQPEALRLARVASNLEASCSGAPPAQPVSARHAAVLVPLFEDAEGVVRVILTQRASSLPTHSGEVCLPGGKRDPGDADDAATALREAHEELGIPPAACCLLGALPPFLSKHLLSVRAAGPAGPAELARRCWGAPPLGLAAPCVGSSHPPCIPTPAPTCPHPPASRWRRCWRWSPPTCASRPTPPRSRPSLRRRCASSSARGPRTRTATWSGSRGSSTACIFLTIWTPQAAAPFASGAS